MPTSWVRAFVFWISVVLALIAATWVYRSAAPQTELCADHLVNAYSGQRVPLPLTVIPEKAGSDEVLVLEHHFISETAPAARPAVYLGEVAPAYGLYLNSRDLMPGIDPRRIESFDASPQLHALPPDALLTAGNTLTLTIPLSAALGKTRVELLCIGDYTTLLPVQRANWWRRTGVPLLCVVFFIVLAAIALTFWRMNKGVAAYPWYVACALLMMCAAAYRVMPMPVSPVVWRTASTLSVVLLIPAMRHLLALLWGMASPRWMLPWAGVVSLLVLATAGPNSFLAMPVCRMLFWLSIAGVATVLLWQVVSYSRHIPIIERRAMYWVMAFVIGCGMLEAAMPVLVPGTRLTGLYTSGTAALASVLGFLLIRRALLGTALLSHATGMLRHHLDRALLPPPEHSARVWTSLSTQISDSERQQVLRDIDDGFGARMLVVLERLGSDHPHSSLSVDIQRALLDLRLMIDAIDDTSGSVGNALAMLRKRVESTLSAAGIASHWDVAAIADLQVNNRRKLMELFRCLEELLSNVVHHAHATQVTVTGRSDDQMISLQIQDNGCGLPQAHTHGRGLRNVAIRMQILHGSVSFGKNNDETGTRVELLLPRI